MASRLANYREAGAMLGMSPKVLRRLLTERKLSGRKEGREVKITLASIERYVSSIDNEGRFKAAS